VVTNESARAALAAQLPDLRNRLGSAGVNLGGLDVSNGQAGSGSGSGQASGQGSETPVVRMAAATPARSVATAGGAQSGEMTGTVNVIA
jgi:hypothetical protein